MRIRLTVIVWVILAMAASAHAGLVTKNIPYKHGDLELEGYLAYDDSFQGRRPGVLIVHEWWGLNNYARKRAEQFAGLGYVAFALDMYGKGKVTQHPKQAGEWMEAVRSNVDLWVARATAGLAVLKEQAVTDPNRIAAVGYCFGGATVQQLAYSGADVKGVAGFHGPLLAPTDAQAGGVKAKIQIHHGASDAMVKADSIPTYMAAMERSGLDWQMIAYGGAKHSFTNPDADKAGMEALGYSKSTDQRSWNYTKIFLEEVFAMQ